MKEIVRKVRKTLKQRSDTKTKASFQRFFKEQVKFHGVNSATVGKTANEYYEKIKLLPKKEIFDLAEELLQSGYCEEAWIAASWVHKYANYEESDFAVYERWINSYIDNWAECDTFCNHTVGDFIQKYPKCIAKLKKWAKSKNLWLRRASAVCLIVPAKEGKFLREIFELADILLLDKEDMVQKGYGWLLKEASRTHEKEVFDYVVKHKAVVPRTALRYAIEKISPKLRAKAMAK
ncbi:MAG: DNA alkylation repair enzyme [uncultured bacterium]|nr:MAG: DNA alkylation repair enzyme [uncultured bacterium]